MGVGRSFGVNWPRIARWCLLGTFAMLCWLIAPTARCSWRAYMDTPIGDLDPSSDAPAQSDASRVHAEQSFFSQLGTAVKICYARTPLLDQEGWKTGLLFLFAGGGALAYTLGRLEARGKRTVL